MVLETPPNSFNTESQKRKSRRNLVGFGTVIGGGLAIGASQVGSKRIGDYYVSAARQLEELSLQDLPNLQIF
jgi:hypothetical protein